jgi:hypothetical protein
VLLAKNQRNEREEQFLANADIGRPAGATPCRAFKGSMDKSLNRFALDYEAQIAESIELEEGVIFTVRKHHVDPDAMCKVWGDDWQGQHLERFCLVCNEPMLIRPIFEKCRGFVCVVCMPTFLAAVEKNPEA